MISNQANQEQFSYLLGEIEKMEAFVPSAFRNTEKQKTVALSSYYLTKKFGIDVSEVSAFITEQTKSREPDFKIDAFYFNEDLEEDDIAHCEIVQTKFCQDFGKAKVGKDADVVLFDSVVKILTSKLVEDKSEKLEQNLKNFYSQSSGRELSATITFLTNGLIDDKTKLKLEMALDERLNKEPFLKESVKLNFFDLNNWQQIENDRDNVVANLVVCDSNALMISATTNHSAVDGLPLPEKKEGFFVCCANIFIKFDSFL